VLRVGSVRKRGSAHEATADTAGCTFVKIFATPGGEFRQSVTAGSMNPKQRLVSHAR